MEKVFSIVFASFNTPYYIEIGKSRIAQMRKRNLKFFFFVNGPKPDEIDLREGEYCIETTLEKELTWATQALQSYLHEFYKNSDSDKYYYIMRITMTVFINYNSLPWMLSLMPKTNYVGGPYFLLDNKLFCNGTAIILSKDVAKFYANELILDKELCKKPDDVAISWSLSKYYHLQDIDYFYKWVERYTEVPNFQEFFSKIRQQHVFFRVKNEANRNLDPIIWSILSKVYDDI